MTNTYTHKHIHEPQWEDTQSVVLPLLLSQNIIIIIPEDQRISTTIPKCGRVASTGEMEKRKTAIALQNR
ncbi:hypothetical protein ccbrp13_28800 [Ktedonobacteria bacterium brp13]|nr:hypothetical protein ccbrp13_28800 [Ktedonobacteria bacterium brp13]